MENNQSVTDCLHLLLTVGNSMMGDDAVGPWLAERIAQQPIAGWHVIDGGSMPENYIHQIRQIRPKHVLIVDATEMALAPGEIRLISPSIIADDYFVSTHSLPLTFLIEQLQDVVPEIHFLGVQPMVVAFGFPGSEFAKQAVETIYQRLQTWQGDGGFPLLD